MVAHNGAHTSQRMSGRLQPGMQITFMNPGLRESMKAKKEASSEESDTTEKENEMKEHDWKLILMRD